jgi:pimeloyl-ACP methyl ester carboxylesterase
MKQKEPFSFSEIINTRPVTIPEPEYFPASDKIKLAYYSFLPKSDAVCSLVFLHGGGAHSTGGYQYIADGLRKKYQVKVYLLDLRGHGNSGGPRGDSPSAKQIWIDLKLFISFIKRENPDLPLYLGGHSSGGGLVLNYATWKDKTPVDGYIFISPRFGYKSKTDRYPVHKDPFGRPRILTYLVNLLTGGFFFGHGIAVDLSYPDEILNKNPLLLKSYSYNMAKAVYPSNPRQQFKNIDKPFCLLVGENDELFFSERLIQYGDLPGPNIKKNSSCMLVKKANHLSVVLTADEFIGPFLRNTFNVKR